MKSIVFLTIIFCGNALVGFIEYEKTFHAFCFGFVAVLICIPALIIWNKHYETR